jgi:FMN-dependent NADH-azoreductase
MKLLHLDASILGADSASRQLSAAVVERLRAATPGLQVAYRDLADQPLPHLSREDWVAAQAPESQTPELDEFLAADIVVIGAPMYNFTIPSQLKAWIDRIIVRGKTFRYGEAGPEGMAGGKRVIITVSRGGSYGAATPAAAFEHLETYLRGLFTFIGATPEIIIAEGLVVPEQREKSMREALQAATNLQAA